LKESLDLLFPSNFICELVRSENIKRSFLTLSSLVYIIHQTIREKMVVPLTVLHYSEVTHSTEIWPVD
jgi:hypothetical protein